MIWIHESMAERLGLFLATLEQNLDNLGVSFEDLYCWDRYLVRGKELKNFFEKPRSPIKLKPKYLEKPVEQLVSMRRLLS